MHDLPIRLNPARSTGRAQPMADLLDSSARTYIPEQPTPRLAFYLLLAFMLFSFAQFAAWLPGHVVRGSTQGLSSAAWLVSLLRLSLTTSVLALGSILLYKSTRREKMLFTGCQTHLLGLLMLCALASVSLSKHPSFSLEFALLELGGNLLLYLLVINVICNLRSIRIFLWVLVLCGCIPAIGALLANLWPDQFATQITVSGRIGFAGYFENANRLARTLCQLVPLALCLITLSRSYVLKVFLVGVICLYVTTTLLMLSRSGLVALGIVALVYSFSSRHKVRNLAVVLVLAVASFAMVPAALSRVKTIASYQEDASAMGRITLWRAGVAMAIQRPLTGVGIAAFPIASAEYFEASGANKRLRWMAPHNSYVQVGAEMGFIGLAAFVGLTLVSLRDARRVHRRLINSDDPAAHELALLGRALFLAMLASALIGLTGHMAYDWILYVYIALIVCVKQMEKPAPTG